MSLGELETFQGSWGLLEENILVSGIWEQGSWGLLEENILVSGIWEQGKHFRELGRKVIFLLVSLELKPPWKVSLQLSCTFAKSCLLMTRLIFLFVLCTRDNIFQSCRDGTIT